MIQVGKNKTIVGDLDKLNILRERFKENHCIVLKDLLSPDFKKMFFNQLKNSNYNKKVHVGHDSNIIGKEYVLDSDNIIYNMLLLLMNTNEYLNAIKYVTEIDEIKSFSGRVYRLDSTDDCFDNWHDDIKKDEGRLVGLSLNLSTDSYEGGAFLIRDRFSKDIYREVKYKEWGTAHIFRIDNQLQHKVTKVTGDVPRIAYAGWFRSKLGFKDYLKS